MSGSGLTLPTRSEHDARVDIKHRQMIASYRAEGWSEDYIAKHATRELAERMLAYEQRSVDLIAGMFTRSAGKP